MSPIRKATRKRRLGRPRHWWQNRTEFV